jgi:hypothetical protein
MASNGAFGGGEVWMVLGFTSGVKTYNPVLFLMLIYSPVSTLYHRYTYRF